MNEELGETKHLVDISIAIAYRNLEKACIISLPGADFTYDIRIYSDNLIPELRNTAHSCSRHGSAAAWLSSAWPGNVIPVPKTSTLLGVRVLSISMKSVILRLNFTCSIRRPLGRNF